MKTLSLNKAMRRYTHLALMLATASPMFAQASPLGNFIQKVGQELSGPLAMWISTIVIILSACYLGFSDGRGKGAVITGMFAVVIIMGAARMVGWLGV